MNNDNNNFKNNNKSLKEWVRTLNIYLIIILIIFLTFLGLALTYFFNKSFKSTNIKI